MHAALGDQQRAMEFLELTFAESSDFFGFVHHPVFDPLRGTAEFREFARRYNLPDTVERLNRNPRSHRTLQPGCRVRVWV